MTRIRSFTGICAALLLLANISLCQAQSASSTNKTNPPIGHAPYPETSGRAPELSQDFIQFGSKATLDDGNNVGLMSLAVDESFGGLGIESNLASDTTYSTPSGLETRTGILADSSVIESRDTHNSTSAYDGFTNQDVSLYDDIAAQKNISVAAVADPFSAAIKRIDPWKAARYTKGGRLGLWVAVVPLILFAVMISVAVQAIRHNHLGNTSVSSTTLFSPRNSFGSNG